RELLAPLGGDSRFRGELAWLDGQIRDCQRLAELLADPALSLDRQPALVSEAVEQARGLLRRGEAGEVERVLRPVCASLVAQAADAADRCRAESLLAAARARRGRPGLVEPALQLAHGSLVAAD